MNLTKHDQIFANGQKTEIELFDISYNFSLFLILYRILSYLFANIPYKFCSMGSEFTINDDEKDKLFI